MTNAGQIKAYQAVRALTGEQMANSDVVGDVVDPRQLDAIQKPEETF